jgi:2,3-dihydroxybenzoate-AMP ligase
MPKEETVIEGCTPWPQELVRDYVRTGCWEARSLANALEDLARESPQRLFVSDKDGNLTYAEVNRLAGRVALELIGCGLQPRDIVLLQLPNVRDFVVVFFALHKIGVVPVMCLPAHRHSELTHFAQLTGAKAHFFAPGFRGFDFLTMAREVQAGAPTLRLLIATGHGTEPGVTYLAPLMDQSSDEVDRESALARYRANPFDVAFMLLSGGTTGVPKLIPRTHADYLYNARMCAQALGWGSDTVYTVALPAAHNFALGAPGIVAVLTVGGSVTLCSSTDAEEVFGAIERNRGTVLPGTPALIIALLNSPQRNKYDLSSLRQVCVGGQRMLPELFDRVRATFSRAVTIQAFGMSEGLTNLTRPEDPLEVRRETQGRPVSPADEIRIVDEDGIDVPAGAVGELITRGPYTIRGYYRAEQHNRVAFTAAGFYRTGDLVRLHPSGNIIIEGRKKDMINRGGEKISAEEIENLILSHESVQLVALVAMPDPVMGERSCAFVVPKNDASLTLTQLNEFLMEKKIAKFKLPERLEVVDSLPVTAMGKISKKALREQIASKLRLENGG